MGKRRTVRASASTYIPFGKPNTVTIERVNLGTRRDPDIRWVETFEGGSYSTSTKRAKDTGKVVPKQEAALGEHARGCKGRPGVARVYYRAGRELCRSCYEFVFRIDPRKDPLREDPKVVRTFIEHAQSCRDRGLVTYRREDKQLCEVCYRHVFKVNPRLDRLRETASGQRAYKGVT